MTSWRSLQKKFESMQDWDMIEQRLLDKSTHFFFEKIYAPAKEQLNFLETKISEQKKESKMKVNIMNLLVKKKSQNKLNKER